MVTGAAAQGPSLRWDELHEPVYPQMARIAHIRGRVVLDVTLQPDGTVTIQDVSGHPILVQAVRDSIQKSKLICEDCSGEPHTFSLVYEFKMADPPPPPAVQPRAIRRYRVRSIRCMYLWRCASELR
jgi:TonB family protein